MGFAVFWGIPRLRRGSPASQKISPAPYCSFDAVIHTQESPPHKRFSLGCRSLFMRLAKHLTVLRAWFYIAMSCLVGENATCSVPALWGCESMVIRLPTAMHGSEHTPHPSPTVTWYQVPLWKETEERFGLHIDV